MYFHKFKNNKRIEKMIEDDRFLCMERSKKLLLDKDLLIRIDKKEVWLSISPIIRKVNGKWLQFMMNQISKQIYQWNIHALWTWNNKYQFIIKQIEHISMQNLQRFATTGNQIQSVQILCRLNMPHLQELYLSRNSIVSVKSLRKCVWPQIQELRFDCNYIKNVKIIEEMHGRILKNILIEMSKEDVEECWEISWVGKLQTKVLKWFLIENEVKIKQNRNQRTLKKKYQNLQFRW